MSKRSCQTCQYLQPFGELVADLGECRRRAPQPVLARMTADDILEAPETPIWPRMASGDWCGEWAPSSDRERLRAGAPPRPVVEVVLVAQDPDRYPHAH